MLRGLSILHHLPLLNPSITARHLHISKSHRATVAASLKVEPASEPGSYSLERFYEEDGANLGPEELRWDEILREEESRFRNGGAVASGSTLESGRISEGTLDDRIEEMMDYEGESGEFGSEEWGELEIDQDALHSITSPTLTTKKEPTEKVQNKAVRSSRPKKRIALEPPIPTLRVQQTDSKITPYQPFLALSTPPQPHDFPLLSRSDWRLLSPVLPRTQLDEPPDLYEPLSDPAGLFRTDGSQLLTTSAGHNKMIGVGLDPFREAARYFGTEGEDWGWKKRIGTESDEWDSADAYIKKQTRLLELTAISEELTYLSDQRRLGTPAQRESKGLTICSAIGSWSGSDTAATARKIDEIHARAAQLLAERSMDMPLERTNVSVDAVAIWKRSDDGEVERENHYKKYVPGVCLRFTPNTPESSGPKPPLLSSGEKFCQGTLLEVRDGALIVAFQEVDMFHIEGDYRIDIGRDESTDYIQRNALAQLYFDPEHQLAQNAIIVSDAQTRVLEEGKAKLEEVTLAGSSIRELLVPDLNTSNYYGRKKRVDEFTEVFAEDSPDQELQTPESLLPISPSLRSLNPSTLFTDNQLINSWVKRYRRNNPIVMDGDPETGLNKSQTKAVAMALSEQLSLIQGPPGTGKSQTIVTIILLLKRHFRVPQPILLAAPTHVAVDELLKSLVEGGVNPLRMGKASRVKDGLQKWSIEKRREMHPMWQRSEELRLELEECRNRREEAKDQLQQLPKDVSNTKRMNLIKKLDALSAAHMKAWRRFHYVEHRMYASLLATADVFLTTAMGAGNTRIMSVGVAPLPFTEALTSRACLIYQEIDFPIVLIDEAAMCTEPVTLVPLMKGASHVTLIGDHMQLPAVCTSKTAKDERLHVSLFERLMAQQSVNSVLLSTQYRMRPEISGFPNQAFYKSAISDGLGVRTRNLAPLSQFCNYITPADSPSSEPQPSPVVFIDHNFPEMTTMAGSTNRGEIDIIVEIVGDLLYRNPDLSASNIGIITPYNAQNRLLISEFNYRGKMTLKPLLGWERASEIEHIEIHTLDGFQGREKKVIILSTVRSNINGNIGFLNDKRRLNVALTRAKDNLFVVGNKRTLMIAKESMWGKKDPDTDNGIWRNYIGWLEGRGLVRTYEGNASGIDRSGRKETEMRIRQEVEIDFNEEVPNSGWM